MSSPAHSVVNRPVTVKSSEPGVTDSPFINMLPRRENVARISSSDPSIPEAYHFEGANNYGVWAYRIRHALQKDSLFDYCITPPSLHMGPGESAACARVLSIFTNNAKNLTLLKRY